MAEDIVLGCATIDAGAMAAIRDFYLLANSRFVKDIQGYELDPSAEQVWPCGYAILAKTHGRMATLAAAGLHYNALNIAFREACENRASRIGTLPRDLRNVITDMLVVVVNGDTSCFTMRLGIRHSLPDLPYDLRYKLAGLRGRWSSGVAIEVVEWHVAVAFGPNQCSCNCGSGKSYVVTTAAAALLGTRCCVCGAPPNKTPENLEYDLCNTHNTVRLKLDPHEYRVKLLNATIRLAAVSHDIRYALTGGRPGVSLQSSETLLSYSTPPNSLGAAMVKPLVFKQC